jgi:cell filamentation protein
MFAHPQDARIAVDYALKIGHRPEYMAEHPGEVMGYLAHGHPFLDGNGRAITVVHNELAHRAGISIEWPKIEKQAYLEALTRELLHPDRGELDKLLKPFVGTEISREWSRAALAELPGLGPERGKGRGGRGGR